MQLRSVQKVGCRVEAYISSSPVTVYAKLASCSMVTDMHGEKQTAEALAGLQLGFVELTKILDFRYCPIFVCI